MTSEQTLVVAFAAFIGTGGSILTAMAFYIRANATKIQTNSDAQGYADKTRADGELLREKSAANVTDKLVEIAAASMKIQQDGLKLQEDGQKIQREMVEVARLNGAAFNENAAQMRGMVSMQDEHTKLLRTTAQSIDDIDTRVETISKVTDSLKTDIEGSLGGQFGPIVTALTGIGLQLTALVTSTSAKDANIELRLTEIIEELRQTHKQFMEKLGPLVLKHLGEITDEKHAENGNAVSVLPAAE